MTDMIEQMAWVMYESERERVIAGTMRQWNRVSPSVKNIWMTRAADALSALEEPSDEIVQAGVKAFNEFPDHEPGLTALDEFRAVFTAMIRAAKENAPNPVA